MDALKALKDSRIYDHQNWNEHQKWTPL